MCSEYRVMPCLIRRNAYQQYNLIEVESLPTESVNSRSVISPVVLVDIHPLSCENGANDLLKVMINRMQGLNDLP